jgi:hypothetical protein
MLGILALTLACGPSGLGGLQATSVPPPVGTIALPTAQPRPTIVVTVPATQELPQEDLAGQAEAMVMENVGDIDQFPGATRYAIKAEPESKARPASASPTRSIGLWTIWFLCSGPTMRNTVRACKPTPR